MIVVALVILVVALFVALPLIGMAAWAVISALVVGLVIGAVARLIVPGRQQIGLVATALLGLLGSIVGGFLGYHVFAIGGFSILLEIAIAVLGVAIYARSAGRRRQVGPPGAPPSLGHSA